MLEILLKRSFDSVQKNRKKIKEIILCSLFAALIAAGAFIKIPVPVVPFTLQFLFTDMAGLLLGSRLGFIAVMSYIAVGLAGIPVFAHGGGINYVLQPSFGYLIGFAAGTFITGKISEIFKNPSFKILMLANVAGLLTVYAFGMIYYAFMSNFYLGDPIGLWPLFLYCFILAIPGEIALCFLSASLGNFLIPILREM